MSDRKENKRALVLSSGGVDSTTCLALAVSKYGKENVTALEISYGQKHTKEKKIFEYSNCSLLEHSTEEIPEESYDEQIKKTDGKPVSTYVPFRNGLFLSTAASIAISKDCDVIYYGIHRDDAAGSAYPDCSDEFNQAMSQAIYLGSGKQVEIVAPFVDMNKAGVVKTGLELGAPYELTWSCYEGGEKPCGKCGTCIDRARAFAENGVKDPALV